MRPRTPRLPPEAASITPQDLTDHLLKTGWSQYGAGWLAHEMPLREALVYMAIREGSSPWELADRILFWKAVHDRAREFRAEESRAAQAPKPINRGRRRR